MQLEPAQSLKAFKVDIARRLEKTIAKPFAHTTAIMPNNTVQTSHYEPY